MTTPDLHDMALGHPLSTWLLALAAVLAGWLGGRLVVAVLRAVLRPARRPLAQDALGRSAGAIRLATMLVGLQAGLSLLTLPDRLATFLEQGVRFAQVLALAWALTGVYEATHARLAAACAGRPGSPPDLQRLELLRVAVRGLIWTAGLATALGSVGVELTAVLAALGLAGLALALAAQGTMANLLGGLRVLMLRPFQAGQHIRVAGLDGEVRRIGLHSTTLADAQGRELQLPNQLFTRHAMTRIDGPGCGHQQLRLRLAPWTPAFKVEQALAILRDIVTDHALLLKTCWTAFDQIAHGHLELEFWYAVAPWRPDDGDTCTSDFDKRCRARTQVNLAILRRFEAAGIALAVPLQMALQPDEPRRDTPQALRQAA